MRTTEGHPVSRVRSMPTLSRVSVHRDRQRHPFAVYLSWIIAIVLMLAPSCGSVSVQAPLPAASYIVTAGALSTTTKTQFLILDGMTYGPSASSIQPNATSVTQFIALDLTTAWNASQPVWSKVANSRPVADTLFTGFLAPSLDGQYLGTFGGLSDPSYIGMRYTFASGIWAAGPSTVTSLSVSNYRAAQDPETGLVYIAEVHENIADSLMMYCFDITQNAPMSDAHIPAETVPGGTPSMVNNTKTYSVVYSAFRKSLLYLGGQAALTGQIPFALTEFVPSSSTWRRLLVQGGGPSNRADHCMASNENGTKVIVFGGRLATGVLQDWALASDLWILDVPTMTWTQGPSSPNPRALSACTIVNDTLINWGGYSGSTGLSTNPTPILLFDLKTNTFVDVYKPSGWNTPSPKASAIATTAGRTQATNTVNPSPIANGASDMNGAKDGPHDQAAIIAGGVAGGCLLVAAVGAGFFFYRRKRSHLLMPFYQSSEWSSTGDYDRDAGVALHEKRVLAAFSPYLKGGSGTETTPMKTEFHEQERQHWWIQTKPQAHMSPRNKSMLPENTVTPIIAPPPDAFKIGGGVAVEAGAASPRERGLQMQGSEAKFRERQSLVPLPPPQRQHIRDSALIRQSLNSPGIRNTFGSGTPPAAAFHPSPFQRQSQYQGRQAFSPQREGQHWLSTPPVASFQQLQLQEQRRQSSQQMNRQSLQQQLQQNQRGLVSPPTPNYQTRPPGY